MFFLVAGFVSFVLSFSVGFVDIAHLVAEIWPFQNYTSFFFFFGKSEKTPESWWCAEELHRLLLDREILWGCEERGCEEGIGF